MANTIELTKFVKHPDGRVELVYTLNGSGGRGRVYPEWDAFIQDMNVLDNGDEDTLVRLVVSYWRARDADLSNFALVKNKTLTVDFSAPSPIKLQ